MEESRKKILEMLAEGKVTVEEAAVLLEKVASGDDTPSAEPPSPPEPPEPGGKKKPRYLRVLVESADGDNVNVRVPLSLIKTGIKLKALIPAGAADAVSEKGFDLSRLTELDEDELVRALSEIEVDVDSANGDTVRIFTE
ncbi:hypothetical protein GF402_10760 [Candidatus Fermentibacteria bacterium]|nr:hypothetical protein [Candidatus Fermentibacteria bacterium]